MKTLQTEISSTAKLRRPRVWIGCFTLLLGLPMFLYYGYCWGWWGRQSLLLQFLFQCNCPAASEEARYSEEVDVIGSGCRRVNTGFKLSPSGRFLYIREEENEHVGSYLLDLQTMERMKVTDQRFSSFLTDVLWFVDGSVNAYIIESTTGTKYAIKSFRYWQDNAFVNGAPNLELLVLALQQADKVFVTQNHDSVVVLMLDFRTNPEKSFTFWGSDILKPFLGVQIEEFLRANNVTYQTILADFPHEAVSPDGRFIARDDGIYLVGTNEMIVKTPIPGVRAWTYDGRGVIYASSRCLFRIGFPADGGACLRWISQPVIKLIVPEEFWLPAQTP
jgi:hypothetical protein